MKAENIVIENGMNKSVSEDEVLIDYINVSVTENKNSKELSFENSKTPESYSSEDKSSIMPSSVVLNSNYNNSNIMQFINTTEHIRLAEKQYSTYEYEDVNEESELEEEIDEFSFIIDNNKENKDSEKFEKIIDYEKNSNRNQSFNIDDNNFSTTNLLDKRLSTILEKLSMSNTIENQSKTEDLMIKMFNYQINAFPNYRLHYNNQIVNNTELIF